MLLSSLLFGLVHLPNMLSGAARLHNLNDIIAAGTPMLLFLMH